MSETRLIEENENVHEVLKQEIAKNKKHSKETKFLQNENLLLKKEIENMMQNTGDVVKENQIANFETEKMNS